MKFPLLEYRNTVIKDFVLIATILIITFFLSTQLDLFEKTHDLIHVLENLFVTSVLFSMVLILLSIYRYIKFVGEIDRRQALEQKLKFVDDRYKTIYYETLNPVFTVDQKGNYLAANPAGLDFLECNPSELIAKNIWDTAPPDKIEEMKQRHSPFLERRTVETDYLVNGKVKTLLLNVLPISNGDETYLYGIGHDITERKQTEQQLKYYALHDHLTGLKNRAYFEQKLEYYKATDTTIGIVLIDLDGLKLINDTLGHPAGDNYLIIIAETLIKNYGSYYELARIGGDEFAILIPNANKDILESVCNNIEQLVDNYNESNNSNISISLGHACQGKGLASVYDVFKEADNQMYRRKLHRKQSNRNAITQTLVNALEARDFNTEGHCERLELLITKIAEAFKMSSSTIYDLKLFARFHDIGKVGISDQILFKPGRLTKSEFIEMQRHSEIGYRIAQSSLDLAPIAEWILKHHEWWNGKGYPLGLKGEQIPLESRILSIIDAYDAMTNTRPYRKPLTHEEAVAELQRCAGTQFDPKLTPIIIDILEEIHSKDSHK
ncbi:MAG: diguanylate cyclase [Firmicutes bacterium]|nr:diguanylate cyclase [Bacillota bacterium]